MDPEIQIELLEALSASADQTGCSDDLIVVSSIDLAAVLHAAGVEFSFAMPDMFTDGEDEYMDITA